MKFLETAIDEFVDLLKKRQEITLEEASEELDYEEEIIEDWAHVLEEHNVIEIDYGITHTKFKMVTREGKDIEREDKDIVDYKEILSGTIKEAKAEIEGMKNPDYNELLTIETENKNRKSMKSFLENKIKNDKSKQMLCMECGKKFEDVDGLTKHLREEHFDD